ncbi:hypothetical protein PUNSTDRAFT_146509 [Punctularia strigosozonata HHB-11173 SS5]|uniref:C2H2-type domain-containing protein n=1 Tax=Punctularia strigosozonata (strain HHB-11173) TaxID=741275 RepID=R7S4R6_PUNST|nr:uncharacterized protein PUNSTDRAFT_146509 [Punctularia strigosozonata HHB-11173 SS5]EIN04236.1 hypothetical protein PUNSTDRAFT_146509 [Punctularia strigosozonata HHB-11173 SS5]
MRVTLPSIHEMFPEHLARTAQPPTPPPYRHATYPTPTSPSFPSSPASPRTAAQYRQPHGPEYSAGTYARPRPYSPPPAAATYGFHHPGAPTAFPAVSGTTTAASSPAAAAAAHKAANSPAFRVAMHPHPHPHPAPPRSRTSAMPSPPPTSASAFFTFDSSAHAHVHPAAASTSQAVPGAAVLAGTGSPPLLVPAATARSAEHPASQRRRERRELAKVLPAPSARPRAGSTKSAASPVVAAKEEGSPGQQSFQLGSASSTSEADSAARDEEAAEAEADSKHGDRKHQCPECKKRFNRPSSLRIHFNVHDGNKPFKCPFPGCGRFFNVNSNMRRHFRNHGQPSIAKPGPNHFPYDGQASSPSADAARPSQSPRQLQKAYPPLAVSDSMDVDEDEDEDMAYNAPRRIISYRASVAAAAAASFVGQPPAPRHISPASESGWSQDSSNSYESSSNHHGGHMPLHQRYSYERSRSRSHSFSPAGSDADER